MRKVKNSMRAAILVAATLLIAGCPGTDVLQLSISNVDPQLAVTNPGTSRYDTASFTLTQVTVVAVDPATQAAFGAPLSLIQTPRTIDLNSGGSELTMVPLNTGTYRVTSVVTSPLELRDDNPSTSPVSCVDGIVDPGVDAVLGTADDFSLVPDPRATNQDPSYTFTDFSGSADFVVSESGGSIAINIDAAALIAAFEAAINCTPSNMNLCGSGSSSYVSRNCGNFVVTSSFQAAAPSFITFN